MAGRGKGKTSKSKETKGAGGKRHSKAAAKGRGITKGSIRRIARRGGCRRLSQGVYDEARAILRSFLDGVMADTCALLELTGRRTVRAADVLYSLKKAGKTLYAVA
eukprot:Rhum_TRINITY_DN13061_c0_g1::Rhum_TRINITY_DN13061_c0_g1_i1::g.56555::m.56555/K11254/H4; histone H4